MSDGVLWTHFCPQCSRVFDGTASAACPVCPGSEGERVIPTPPPSHSTDLKAKLLALLKDPEVAGAVDGWLKERLSVFSDNLAERIDSEQAHRGSGHRPKGSHCPLPIGYYLERFLFNAGKSFGEGVRAGKGTEQ